MPTLLRYADVLDRLRSAARGREDYVNAVLLTPDHPEWHPDTVEGEEYATCRYLTDEGRPSCIVGTAFYTDLVSGGLTPERRDNAEAIRVVFARRLPGFAITPKALHLLEDVQGGQDQGDSWGAAIEAAVRCVESSGLDDTAAMALHY